MDNQGEIRTFSKLLKEIHHMYHWVVDSDLIVQEANCEENVFFYQMFQLGSCPAYMADYLKDHDVPVILYDQFDLHWLAVKENADRYHLIGPVFSSEVSKDAIWKIGSQLHLSDSLKDVLPAQLEQISILSWEQIMNYLRMMCYCITGEKVPSHAIHVQKSPQTPLNQPWYEATTRHGTWLLETALLQNVEKGSHQPIQSNDNQAGGQVGRLSPDNPLRQAKNESIVFTALCTRAAIRGGLAPEIGYGLGDYYIQKTEKCKTVSEVAACETEMYEHCIERVSQTKNTAAYSSTVRAVMDYIEAHLTDKVELSDMAAELGYADYYLTKKFSKETGESISNYIQRRKIELAKELLAIKTNTVTEASELLGFTSPSYFGSVFRKYTGMTPSAYQKNAPKLV